MSLESVESNIEIRVKLSAGISKGGTYKYIYYHITKSEEGGVGSENLGVTD